jgi:hypothetical protein
MARSRIIFEHMNDVLKVSFTEAAQGVNNIDLSNPDPDYLLNEVKTKVYCPDHNVALVELPDRPGTTPVILDNNAPVPIAA